MDNCEYCNMSKKLHADVKGGKDFSETDGGTMQIESVNGFYYITTVCFNGDATEGLSIKYCPMCGKKLWVL